MVLEHCLAVGLLRGTVLFFQEFLQEKSQALLQILVRGKRDAPAMVLEHCFLTLSLIKLAELVYE